MTDPDPTTDPKSDAAGAASPPPPGAPPGAVHGAAALAPPAAKPADLPEKFWDAARGAVRLDALIQSYRALERRLSAGEPAPVADQGVPARPEEYRLEVDTRLVQLDPEVNALLHAEGFSERQAQLVYDLAAEVLGPIAQRLTAQAASAGDRAKLEAHFGGPERWAEMRRQLKRWAAGKLPDDAYKALASSYEGVLALHRMMERKEEPAPLNEAEPPATLSEEQLRRKMRDPRYWRERDPTILRDVSDGFKRLYPNG
ncbi:MAG: hypothetical protein RIB45_04370 [Marivibrio sp.]|uniref:capsid assembly protein n=1 Tax=Marivibrio sp. TaxID=2039719 RepID=UPI0032EA994B